MVRPADGARTRGEHPAVTPRGSTPPHGRRTGSGPRARRRRDQGLAGTELVLDVGEVAHGGTCVARHDGRVVFVRHSLPGEQVRAVVTDGGAGSRFLRADAVEVLRPSPHRVPPPCPYAGPSGCGGCDLQHVDLAEQRAGKGRVVAEHLRRLAGVDVAVSVEPLPGSLDGGGWRTRVDLTVDPRGRAGFRGHRSHRVVPVSDCFVADPRVGNSGVFEGSWPPGGGLRVVCSDDPPEAVVLPPRGPAGAPAPPVRHVVETTRWRGVFHVHPAGFWQGHAAAPATYLQRMLDAVDPRPGERLLDLYAGAGLFAVPLADAVGPGGRVLAVEADASAAADAAAHAVDRPQLSVHTGSVASALAGVVARGEQVDAVVLDPPRSGAGREVMAALGTLRPRVIGYLACDPAALARDVGYAREQGWRLDRLWAFDAFPMTHHVECLAILRPPVAEDGGPGAVTSHRGVGEDRCEVPG